MGRRSPPIALRSQHFTSSADVGELTRCLNDDQGHIQIGASGDKVRKIQQALRNVPGIVINDKEFDGMSFGPSTAAAVRQYKGPPRNIVQPWQSAPDPIVGMQTLQSLDELMAAGSTTPVQPTPVPDLQIVPFDESQPMLMAEFKDDRSKSDLESAPKSPTGPHFTPLDVRGRVALLDVEVKRMQSNSQLEYHMRVELLVAGNAGTELFHAFKTNNVPKAVIEFPATSAIGALVQDSDEFRAANKQVRLQMTAALEASARTGTVDYKVLRLETGKIAAPLPAFDFSSSPRLKFAIGYVQGSRVLLKDFEAVRMPGGFTTYRAKVVYEFFDHFGADDDDLLMDRQGHGSNGQVALWVLQRERHPGYTAFVSKIVIEHTFSDLFWT